MTLFSFLRGKKRVRAAATPIIEEVLVTKTSVIASCEVNAPLAEVHNFSHLDLMNFMNSLLSTQLADEDANSSALVEYARSEGADDEILAVAQTSYTQHQGYAGKIVFNGISLLTLLGNPVVISRATAPFHQELDSFVQREISDQEMLHMLAIDGVAYATFKTATKTTRLSKVNS